MVTFISPFPLFDRKLDPELVGDGVGGPFLGSLGMVLNTLLISFITN